MAHSEPSHSKNAPKVASQSKNSRWIAVGNGLLGGLTLFAALCYEAARTGLSLIPAGIILLFPLVLFAQIILRAVLIRLRASPIKVAIGQAGVWLLVSGYYSVEGYLLGTPKAVFERFVMRPALISMKDFHWQGWTGVGGDRFLILTFHAEPAETKALLAHFRLVTNSDYPSSYISTLFVGDTTNATGSCNINLSNRCANAKLPFEPLTLPVVYCSLGEFKPGSHVELVTDTNYARVYVFLE